MLKLTEENSLNKNAVYERIRKSADWLEWLCQNLCRKEGFLAPLPQWLENRRVCLVDASDESKPGSRGADYRLHYLLELYRMRWQIELVFKRFKSIFHYDEIPSKNEKTAYAWFYGKLLIAAICESLVNQGRFSPEEK